MNPSGAAHTGHDTRPKLKVELGTYNGGGDLCNSDVELLCSTKGGVKRRLTEAVHAKDSNSRNWESASPSPSTVLRYGEFITIMGNALQVKFHQQY